MILLISPYKNSQDCATLIERSTHDTVKVVDSIRLALASLRSHEFTAVVADENLLECSPGSADTLVGRMGTAVPVFVDMACLRIERVASMVCTACRRRDVEYKIARNLAVAELRSEFKSDVTGLLLSSELALGSLNIKSAAAEKLAGVLEIARRMKSRLEESNK